MEPAVDSLISPVWLRKDYMANLNGHERWTFQKPQSVF